MNLHPQANMLDLSRPVVEQDPLSTANVLSEIVQEIDVMRGQTFARGTTTEKSASSELDWEIQYRLDRLELGFLTLAALVIRQDI